MKVSSQKVKERGAHFTPPQIANYMARHLVKMLRIDAGAAVTVLDPSCGDGALLSAIYDVLSQCGHAVNLIGVENDSATLSHAYRHLSNKISSDDTLKLVLGDFLECYPEGSQLPFVLDEDKSDRVIPLVDVVIANPPYVRTQIIGTDRSRELSKRFGLSGKTDLYHAFFVAYHAFIKPDGILGIITSNRYLYTKTGSVVRRCIASNYAVEEIDDLGDTKVFSAAVLPAILFARQKNARRQQNAICKRIYEAPKESLGVAVQNVASILESPNDGLYEVDGFIYCREDGHIKNMDQYKEPWVLCSSKEEEWLNLIDSSAHYRLGEIAKVRVGIKTTADNVFIRQDWDSLDPEIKPESALLKPLLSSCNATRWYLSDMPENTILYPHVSVSGKRQVVDLDDYPHAGAYLTLHYDQLYGRSYVRKAKRKWYEIWVPQDPSAWQQPKIVFPDISSNARFYLDRSGALVDGNCYWIAACDALSEDLLLLIMGVANSKLMDRYHASAFQNVLYSGKRRYLTQYVEQYPIPDPASNASMRLVAYLRDCIDLCATVDEKLVDALVFEAFGVNSF